jgi:hypothetical protein
MTNSGNVTLQGGLTGPQTAGGPGYGGLGAQAIVTGTLTNSGTLLANGGGGGYRYLKSPVGQGATLSLSGALINTGLIIVETGQALHTPGVYGTNAQFTDSGVLTNAGTIFLERGLGLTTALTVTAGATLIDSGTLSGGGTLVNHGLVESGAAGVDTGAIRLAGVTNDGIVAVAAHGGLYLGGNITADATATGLFNLAGHASLTFGSTVAASQTIAFIGQGDTLGLAIPGAFAGTLSGLAATDTIDLMHTYVASATSSGDTLTLGLGDSTTLDLSLAAPLGNLALYLTSDGHGGTDLIMQANPTQPTNDTPTLSAELGLHLMF